MFESPSTSAISGASIIATESRRSRWTLRLDKVSLSSYSSLMRAIVVHAINDILDHGRDVFFPEVDALVRDIARFLPRYRMWDLVDWHSPPPLDEFTAKLRAIRDDHLKQARERGWEA